ncbi:telomerase Cajal body protein 1 isoform X3 [Bacillus rossius redtenbacheri]|uniref:telomerase Cajal body protein 1 isoform X3 n=1 Tax=Bacillus rossius redtenbacheri TaxID=93214 RepID=UPI002FDF00E9
MESVKNDDDGLLPVGVNTGEHSDKVQCEQCVVNSYDNPIEASKNMCKKSAEESEVKPVSVSDQKNTRYLFENLIEITGARKDFYDQDRLSYFSKGCKCLVSSSQFSPIHLWDAFTGELRCTYSVFNHLDELDPAFSVAFDASGERLYAGCNSKVCVFRTGMPGRVCQARLLKDTSLHVEKQYGLVGCIAVNPVMSSIYAVGSYAKSIGLYCEPDGTMLCLLQGHTGGITHLEFSPDGTRLYSGGRKDPEILCWDMRYPGTVLFSAHRAVHTNQRVYFNQTSNGKFLLSGTTEGSVIVWDTTGTPEATSGDPVLRPCKVFPVHKDAVCGVSLHQQYPILATSSGQRHFPKPTQESDDDLSDKIPKPLFDRTFESQENCLKLWWAGKESVSLS